MTRRDDDYTGGMVAEPATGAVLSSLPEALRDSHHRSSNRDPYLAAAIACLPRWLFLVGPAPWLDVGATETCRERGAASSQSREQAATLGIALLNEAGADPPAREYLHECVRASLTRWQLTLQSDGRPAPRSRRSSLHGVTAGFVVQLLSETTGHQTGELLADLDRHLHWLAQRRAASPWIEAATIGALADGALLVRDRGLLDQAKKRLAALLTVQDEEGWFPERGGADVGRLSLTVDVLARLYRHNGWEELDTPLQRALAFLAHFVHPDGTVGGCYGSCGTGFLSPYGVELLAETHPAAASLAAFRRDCYDHADASHVGRWHDDLCAVLGPRLALAASVTPKAPLAPSPLPCDGYGRTHFRHADLSIFSTPAYYAVVGGRSGGSLRVTWRDRAPGLIAPGVTVLFARRVRTSARCSRRNRVRAEKARVTVGGKLRKPVHEKASRWRGLFRRLRGVARSETVAPPVDLARTPAAGQPRDRSVTADRFQREIQFEADAIRIRDVVECRLPCQTIVCQSLPTGDAGRMIEDPVAQGLQQPPIFIDGGRYVRIARVYRDGRLVTDGDGPMASKK